MSTIHDDQKHEISVGAVISDLSLRFRNGLGTILFYTIAFSRVRKLPNFLTSAMTWPTVIKNLSCCCIGSSYPNSLLLQKLTSDHCKCMQVFFLNLMHYTVMWLRTQWDHIGFQYIV